MSAQPTLTAAQRDILTRMEAGGLVLQFNALMFNWQLVSRADAGIAPEPVHGTIASNLVQKRAIRCIDRGGWTHVETWAIKLDNKAEQHHASHRPALSLSVDEAESFSDEPPSTGHVVGEVYHCVFWNQDYAVLGSCESSAPGYRAVVILWAVPEPHGEISAHCTHVRDDAALTHVRS